MKRRLNRALFLWLVGVVVALGVGLHFLHGAQVHRSAKVLLEQAQKAEEDQKPDRARDYLERYLAVQPRDIEAWLRLADLLERGGRAGSAQAVRALEKALQKDPSREDILLRVVRLYLGMQPPSFSGAKPHLDVLLGLPGQDQDVEVQELAGRVEEGLGHFEQGQGRLPGAREHYEKALELAPDRVEAYTRLAELLRLRLNDATQADTLMDARRESQGGLIASNPTSAKAFLARASYRERHGLDPSGELARRDIAKALEIAPNDVDVLVAAGLLERDAGALEIARVHLDKARGIAPDRPELYQALADLEVKGARSAPDEPTRKGRMQAAVKWLEDGIKELPEAMTLHYSLAGTLAQAQRYEEAEKVIERLQKAGLRPELAQYLNAHVLMGKKEWQKALGQLEPAQLFLASRHDMRELNKQVLLMIGDCYTHLNDPNRRYDAYRRAAAIDVGSGPESDPLWAKARLMLAESLRAQGKIDQAIQEYMLILPRTPELRLPLAQLMTMQNLRLPPDQQRWPFVERLLDDLDKAKPNTMEAAILRAEVLFANKRAPEARAVLEKARDAHPKRIEPWLALAGLAERQNEDVLAVLDAAQGALGPRLEWLVARAGYWGRKKGPGAPDALVQLERDANTLRDEQQNRLWREIATAHAALGMYDRAHALWRQLADRQPNDLGIQMTGFDLALQAKDEEAAAKNAERIRELEGPDGTRAQCAEALLLTRKSIALPPGDAERTRMLARARDLLVRTAAARPNWSRAAVAQAEVAVAQGLDDEAMRFYLRAIDDLGDRSPASIIAAAQVFYNNRRFTDADRMVRLLREANVPISGELRRLVAEIALQNRDYLRALEQAQELISDDSDNPKDLIWLGRLRWAAGQPEAERVLRRAVEVGKDQPETHLTLVAYLAMNGRKEQAIEALDRASADLPPEKATLMLAEGNEVAGRLDQAREKYDQALKEQPNDLLTLRAVAAFQLRQGRFREATPHLRAIIEKHPQSAEARAARRTLVLVTAAGGNPREALKAMENLGLAATPGADGMPGQSNLDDMRTRAQVLALQPNRRQRQEAINLLNQLLASDRPRASDLFLLAQLHEANGNWDESRKAMTRLLESTPEPSYLATFARSLLRHDNLPDARKYLAQLERVAAKQPVTVEIKARVLHAEQKDAEAVKLVREFALAQPQRLLASAQLMEDLKQTEAAEELYREYVKQNEGKEASAVLALAGFLGRAGRTAEALTLIDDKVWNRLPAELASNSSVVLLYGAKADSSQYDRVDARIQKAISEHPNAVSLQFDLANLRALQGRYDEAAQIYRTIFDRDSSRGSTLNNLAWMLALQGGKADEAMQAIIKAMELEGETPELLDTRALIYLEQNKLDDAIQDLENALVVQPKNPEMLFHLAAAYQLSGRTSEATETFRQAQALGLVPEKLHPLERPRFTRMAAELAANE